MIKKFFLSTFVIVVFTLYALKLQFGGRDDGARTIVPNTSPNDNQAVVLPTPIASSNPPPTNKPIASAQPVGKYRDGTYTGLVADAFYGNIQVQAVITGGKITDVIFLQSPNDRNTSIMINSQAMPILKQEAIQVQSAQVDGASGATASSQAFIQSLGDALRQAAI